MPSWFSGIFFVLITPRKRSTEIAPDIIANSGGKGNTNDNLRAISH
jgi:hypothetical protein